MLSIDFLSKFRYTTPTMINKYLPQHPIAYVTRDRERAQGLQEIDGQYLILSNDQNSELLATYKLLKQDHIADQINKNKANVVVFKNTAIIQKICRQNNWNLLNPPASLAQEIEDKISQVNWLNELASYLPKHFIGVCGDIEFDNEKSFILQFNRTHTGSGTYFIKTKKDLEELKTKFPERPVKISEYINGPVLTCNIVVTNKAILLGNISYQITGLKPFTQNTFATIGNDWGVTNNIISQDQKDKILEIGKTIGKKMQSQDWRGLFGIDIIIDEKTKQVYLLEINARQPASTTFESKLQSSQENSENNITTFDAHLTSLLNKNVEQDIININTGSQIVIRNTEKLLSLDQTKFDNLVNKIKALDYNVTVYHENDKIDADKIRVQSKDSFVDNHSQLNQAGKELAKIILDSYEA